jgi:hypothetical protein
MGSPRLSATCLFTVAMLSLCSGPAMADEISFNPISAWWIGGVGTPPIIPISGNFSTDGSCTVCTVGGYPIETPGEIQSFNISFGMYADYYIGGPYPFSTYGSFEYDFASNDVIATLFDPADDSLLMNGGYFDAIFTGTVEETGTYTVNGNTVTPEPASVILLLTVAAGIGTFGRNRGSARSARVHR